MRFKRAGRDRLSALETHASGTRHRCLTEVVHKFHLASLRAELSAFEERSEAFGFLPSIGINLCQCGLLAEVATLTKGYADASEKGGGF